jgi:hypothetical protein
MYLHQIASSSFVAVNGDRDAVQALTLLRHLRPKHLVVRETTERLHLFTREQVTPILLQARPGDHLATLLSLSSLTPAPILDAYSDADAAPDRCLVQERGGVTGVLDFANSEWNTTTRGAIKTHSGAQIDEGYAPACWNDSLYEDFQIFPTHDHGHSTKTEPDGTQSLLARTLLAWFPKRVASHSTTSLLVTIEARTNAATGLPLTLPTGSVIDSPSPSKNYYGTCGTVSLRFKSNQTSHGFRGNSAAFRPGTSWVESRKDHFSASCSTLVAGCRRFPGSPV